MFGHRFDSGQLHQRNKRQSEKVAFFIVTLLRSSRKIKYKKILWNFRRCYLSTYIYILNTINYELRRTGKESFGRVNRETG